MKHYAYAQVTDAEHAMLKAAARREGLSVSNFVRRCVNSYLLELDEDAALLAEVAPRVRTPKLPSLRGPGRPRNADRWT